MTVEERNSYTVTNISPNFADKRLEEAEKKRIAREVFEEYLALHKQK